VSEPLILTWTDSKEFCARVNLNAKTFFAFYFTTQWFALRLDCVTTLMTGSTAIIVVLLRGSVDSSLAALALLYITSMAGAAFLFSRLSCSLPSLLFFLLFRCCAVYYTYACRR
jgi:hypothetical protein